MQPRFTHRKVLLIAFALTLAVAPVAAGADREPIYDESMDARAAIEAAVAKAGADNRRVLIQWGGNWCGWCYKLHDLFSTNEEIAQVLQYEYEVVMIDSNTNEALAKSMDVDFEGVPYLTVLDGSGKKLTDQETGALEIGDRHDPAKVLGFLNKWKAQPLDAEVELKSAVARAKAEGKAVFVDFSTVWCGWCRKLDAYLHTESIAQILEPHFVVLTIDQERMTNGQALRNRLSKGEGGGVPWFAFVGEDGEVIATSNGPNGNIGFPAEPEGQVHFKSMLAKAAPEITPEQQDALTAPLQKVFDEMNR